MQRPQIILLPSNKLSSWTNRFDSIISQVLSLPILPFVPCIVFSVVLSFLAEKSVKRGAPTKTSKQNKIIKFNRFDFFFSFSDCLSFA